MTKPHYECASRSARQRVEDLTEDQKKRVRSLVDDGQFETAKKSQQLNVAECVFGFQYEAERKKVQRSTPQKPTAAPAPTRKAAPKLAPVVPPSSGDDERTALHRQALSLRIANLK